MSGVDGVVGVLPRVLLLVPPELTASEFELLLLLAWLLDDRENEERLMVSSWFDEPLMRGLDAKMADDEAKMDGNGCGRLSSERGLMPGDLSLASGHLRGALIGALQPRGSISRLAFIDRKKL